MKVTKTLLALALVAAAAVQGTEAAHKGMCGLPANECSKEFMFSKAKTKCRCFRAMTCAKRYAEDPAAWQQDTYLSMLPRHARNQGVEGAKGDLAACLHADNRDMVTDEIGRVLAKMEFNPDTLQAAQNLQAAINASQSGQVSKDITERKKEFKAALQMDADAAKEAKQKQEEEARQAAIAEQERIKEAHEKEVMEGVLGQWGGLVQNKKALKQKIAQRILDTHMERRQKRLMGYDLGPDRKLDTKTAEIIEKKHNEIIESNRRAAAAQKPIADALKQAKGPVYVDVSPDDVVILDNKHMYAEHVPYAFKQQFFGKKAFPDRRVVRDEVTRKFHMLAHIAPSVSLKVIKYDRVHNCLVIKNKAGETLNVQLLDSDELGIYPAIDEEYVSDEEDDDSEVDSE